MSMKPQLQASASGSQRGGGVPPLTASAKQRDAASTLTSDQLAWPHLIRDHIATSLSIEPGDFGFSPFLVAPKLREGGAQRGGLGNLSAVALSQSNGAKVEAHQPVLRSFSEVGLFGEQLPKLLNELNEVLAA